MESSSASSPARHLYAWEEAAARWVFADRLAYGKIWIHEQSDWVRRFDAWGRRWRGLTERGAPIAITLGNHCHFSVRLPAFPDGDLSSLAWLVHELAHTWQYQRLGWAYLVRALDTQLRQGDAGYDFGGPARLEACRQQGWCLFDFNLEQQADILRSAYVRMRLDQDLQAWRPYLQDLWRAE